MSRFEIPTLETERLVMRGPLAKDVDDFTSFYASERSQYVGGPLEDRHSWRMFGLEIGHWDMRGFGMWCVTLKGNDTAIGMVGMWRPLNWPENELGWILWPAAEGKGIGFEAATAARAYAYGTLGWKTAVSYIDAPNERSIALATRLGCWLDEKAETLPTDPDEDPVLVYRHPAPGDLQ